MPTGDTILPAPALGRAAPGFEPSTALAVLDDPALLGLADAAGSAWDAAWIACLTGSPRWAEAAEREFERIAVRAGAGRD